MRMQRYSSLVIASSLMLVASCDEGRLRSAVNMPSPDADNGFDVPLFPDTPNNTSDASGQMDRPMTTDGRGGSGGMDAAAVCGNGRTEMGETCDDGNTTPGDGCNGMCRIEPNFVCPTPGQPCMSMVVCGDGKVMGGEACDDGNTLPGDGCSTMCQVETGWACQMPGQPCTRVMTARCGDGVVNAGELCDDGNVTAGDGCTADCKQELGYACPMPGKPCMKNEFCGDGILNGTEMCDDGNIAPGDGCNGTCRTEPFYMCTMPGRPCVSTIICGDGKIIGDEACDDSNTANGDGCASDCKRVEPGYTCPNSAGVGGACMMSAVDRCGDGKLSYGEYCDDGNTNNNDGCSSLCKVDTGYTCPTPGAMCVLIEWCGNGRLSAGEQCDDGDAMGGDGCSATCVLEANWACPTPGQACVSTIICGDRKITGGETCDDGNTANSDGCSSSCMIETGWTCPSGGVCRPTLCGDGIKVGPEQCDDMNMVASDGCELDCTLTLPTDTEADGWVCPTPGQPCMRTTCGSGGQQGSEQCDDGNNDSGDGCSPFCRKEPICPAAGGACMTSCGDGLLLPIDKTMGQDCDDGNTVSGDGCSMTCKIESGYMCTDMVVTPTTLTLPVILRDFKAYNAATNPHPDFQQWNGCESGIVQDMLGADGKPAHVTSDKLRTTNDYTPDTAGTLQGIDYFSKWYKDDATYNRTVKSTLTFTKLVSGEFQFARADATGNATDGFFPLDGLGWMDDQAVTTGSPAVSNGTHNFFFTSEVRYWFEYKGGEKLDFTGDDDVFVFLNKKLAVDIGGVHGAKNGSVTLNADGTGTTVDQDTTCANTRTRTNFAFGMTVGSVYEIVVFQAERHTSKSAYTLTLSNFTATKSTCNTVCGDAVVAGTEQCDRGTAMNTGAYGTCNADCTLPPRCGDAVLQGTIEQCDNGSNLTPYSAVAGSCAPGCKAPGRCGDAILHAAYGEACDQGANNGMGYGFCTATCLLGPRCGDGIITDAETCDDGINNGTSGSACGSTCQKKCGNGVLDAREMCDNGTAMNTGGYGKCNPDCSLASRCGDGVKQMPPETCDDGKNDGSYGTCTNMCLLGPRCGDGTIQNAAGELCDQGAGNVTTGYGKGMCLTRCKPAPFCGDRAVDVANGEGCDDGVNSGQPGSCTTNCSAYVPLLSCGNGAVEPPEQCDDGANNGTMASTCDTTCRRKCGNGFKDPGEACDDGTNDGTYGTCNNNCTLAPYCGDGTKNGIEQCDLGMVNEANPYGMNKCSTACQTAPYCGDGRIQMPFGEVCDSSPGCVNMCTMVVIP